MRNSLFDALQRQEELEAMKRLASELEHLRGKSSVKAGPPIGADLLTPRQNEIVHLLADGIDEKAIADRLFIKPTTIKTQVREIQKRWGIAGGVMVVRNEAKHRGFGRA